MLRGTMVFDKPGRAKTPNADWTAERNCSPVFLPAQLCHSLGPRASVTCGQASSPDVNLASQHPGHASPHAMRRVHAP